MVTCNSSCFHVKLASPVLRPESGLSSPSRRVLTGGGLDGDVAALRVRVVLQREDARVAARVLRGLRVHQPQGAVPEQHPEAVQLHVVDPRRRGGAVPRPAVVGEDVGGVLPVGEAPVEEGPVQVRRGGAGDGQVLPFGASYL